MKLSTFQRQDRSVGIGMIISDGIIDLEKHLEPAPASMIVLIDEWPDYKTQLESLADKGKADISIDSVTLLAPVPQPGKIFCIGLNYADHVSESGLGMPDSQVWFSKPSTTVNPPWGTVELPKVSEQLDYEAELAFVIGKRCRNVSREDADDVIFGYCAANDLSIRDWQFFNSQFILGKSFDTSAPFGPWIVTPEEIGTPYDLDIKCLVNGEVRQHSNTKHLIFDCGDMIEHLSKAMTLEPGDLILTGTPSGVGAVSKPPRWLKAGDVVEVAIERIGALRNTVVHQN